MSKTRTLWNRMASTVTLRLKGKDINIEPLGSADINESEYQKLKESRSFQYYLDTEKIVYRKPTEILTTKTTDLGKPPESLKPVDMEQTGMGKIKKPDVKVEEAVSLPVGDKSKAQQDNK